MTTAGRAAHVDRALRRRVAGIWRRTWSPDRRWPPTRAPRRPGRRGARGEAEQRRVKAGDTGAGARMAAERSRPGRQRRGQRARRDAQRAAGLRRGRLARTEAPGRAGPPGSRRRRRPRPAAPRGWVRPSHRPLRLAVAPAHVGAAPPAARGDGAPGGSRGSRAGAGPARRPPAPGGPAAAQGGPRAEPGPGRAPRTPGPVGACAQGRGPAAPGARRGFFNCILFRAFVSDAASPFNSTFLRPSRSSSGTAVIHAW